MVKEKKSFKEVREELIEMEKQGVFPNQSFEERDSIYFNNLYNRWKKRHED